MREYEHFVDVRDLPATGGELPRDGWYAHPLESSAAADLLGRAHQHMHQIFASGAAPSDAFTAHLAVLIAGFWLNRAVELQYRSLIATQEVPARALTELVYGQLLFSRKLTGANEHLDRGFALFVPQLLPAEYFALLKRHELLRFLSLGVAPCPPLTLPELLTEARVVRRLRPARQPTRTPPHNDTLG